MQSAAKVAVKIEIKVAKMFAINLVAAYACITWASGLFGLLRNMGMRGENVGGGRPDPVVSP